MKIGIIGLGLIGGSLGLDFKAQGIHQVFGVSRREETCQRAIARQVVDEASPDLALVGDADVVFLCTPLGAIRATVEKLLPHLADHTILTDVGSVKAPVVDAIAPLWANFVGGHPMAGTAESGLDAALSQLFVGRAYVITPVEDTPAEAVAVVAALARSLQSTVYQCHPQDHDRAVAWISHLPVMVSANLIAACMGESNQTVLELAQTFASSGFRDTSRVGGGNPELGVMMARYNQAALVRSLHAYRECLDQLIHTIEQGDWNTLEAELRQTQGDRPRFVD
ncbi:MAG: prephenate/arogenate dehydrogenase [Synechococcales bacterium]|nr:prephenate/arogenate dehydrogenase [Synechococcales bacterium]